MKTLTKVSLMALIIANAIVPLVQAKMTEPPANDFGDEEAEIRAMEDCSSAKDPIKCLEDRGFILEERKVPAPSRPGNIPKSDGKFL